MTSTSLSGGSVAVRRDLGLRAVAIGFVATMVLALGALLAASAAIAAFTGDRSLPGVRAAGVDIGGLDRGAARERLQAQLPSLSSGQATIAVGHEEVSVPYAGIGRRYDLDAMLNAAFGVGRSGDPVADGVARLRTAVRGSDLPPLVHGYDEAALQTAAAGVAAHFSSGASRAAVAVKSGAFVLVPEATGSRVSADEVRAALAAAASTADPADVRIEVSAAPVQPEVTTAQAQAAAAVARAMTATPLVLKAGKDAVLTVSTKQLTALVRFGWTPDAAYGPRIDRDGASSILEGIADKVARSPRDASFIFGADGVARVQPAVDGRALDVGPSLDAWLKAMDGRAAGAAAPDVTLAFSVTPAPLTTKAAQAAASKLKRLSTWTTYYVPGEGNYWGANISIPARDINGKVLAPGEWFDFWRDIGPVTTARGYGYGGAIIGGRSVKDGALAGGICSTSTTLFNAAMRAGLQIGDRTNHYYYINRYPMGLDATVFQTDSYEVNMTFRNDMSSPIVIRAFTGSGFVRFDIWGVSDGRSVSLTPAVTSNHRAARETTTLNPKLPPGTRVRVEYPHDGFDAYVTRTVRASNGSVLWVDHWASAYRPVNGITEVGPSRTAPPPAATATPSASPSPSSSAG